MPGKRSTVRQIREILRLHHEVHLGERQIAAICLVGKGTVQRFLQRATAIGLGWPLAEGLDDTQLEKLLFPPVPAPAGTRPPPDFTKVHQELKSNRSVTLQLLWEEYKESQPDGVNYSWFCNQYRDWARHLDVVLRQDHRAGEKMFVDHAGDTIDIIYPATGESRVAYIFVAVLGASNYTYAEATWTRDLTDWIGSHTRALQYFQGVTKLVVPDQWRAGVSRPCYWEPELNRTYQDWATHNGVAIVPARPRHARDKAKVEQGVLLTQRWVVAVLRKRQFFSLGQLNEAIRELVAKLNQKPFRKLPGTRVELYEKLDRPALAGLPPQPYVFAQWKKVRVGLDYHVEVEGHHYSTPYQLIGQQVEARYTASTVEVLYRGKRVASHPRSSEVPGHSTELAHRPKSHQRYLEWNPTRLLEWAGTIGLFTVRFVEGLLTNHPHPEAGFRAGMGLRPLARQYGEARLESACTRAVRFKLYRLANVRSILISGLDQQPLPAVGVRRSAGGARQHPRRRLLCGARLRGGGRMMIEQTLDKLRALRLSGMVEAYRLQTENPDASSLSFEERLGLMVDQHWTWRENKALARRLKTSRLETEPCVENINYRHSRQLDGAKLRSLLSCEWVTQHLTVIFTGPTGIGKSWLAQALAHKACRDGFSVLYRPAGKLFRELGEARVDGSLGKLLPSLARVDVLVVDDFAMNPLEEQERRLFLEICDDRYRRRSTVLSSQLPVASWHKQIGDPTIADSILDRLVHSAYRFELDGESIRKKQGGQS